MRNKPAAIMIKFLRLIFATSINQISNPQRELPFELHA